MNLKNRQSGQALIGMALIASIVLTSLLMIYNEAIVNKHAHNIRYAEMGIIRSAFEKAAKKLRYLYQHEASCDPQIFSQLIAAIPNPQNMDINLCNTAVTGSCRALLITASGNEDAAITAVGATNQNVFVMMGGVSFSRVDPLTVAPRINDFRTAANASDGISQSAAGVHLRTVYNGIKYEQWIVLLDTCSTMREPLPAQSPGVGVGWGTGFQLGSSYSPLGGVTASTLRCAGNTSFVGGFTGLPSFIDLQTFRSLMTFVSAPYRSAQYTAIDCMDLTQDGIVDDRDLNILEKYWMGWIPAIPVR